MITEAQERQYRTCRLVKQHKKGCRYATRRPESCDCPWTVRAAGQQIDLATWFGEPLPPRRLRSARQAFERLREALYLGSFSLLGRQYSIRFEQLVNHPHLVHRLHPTQIPSYLEHATELLSKATELHDGLARRLPQTARVLGRPLRQVRSIIRLNNGAGFTFEEASGRVAGNDSYALRRLLADLVTDEWLVQDASDHWVLTAKARELQTKSRGKLSRERADGLLAEFVERVHTVNNGNDHAYKVEAVVVFGSYLSALAKIGDIDLAIKLRPRKQSNAEQDALEKSAQERAPSGLNMVAHLYWPQTEVKRTLQGGSPFLELHDMSELEGLFESGATPKHEVIMGQWLPKHAGTNS
jgi:hypothetical protein